MLLEKGALLSKVHNSIDIELPLDFWDWALRTAIILGLAVITYTSISGNIFKPLFHGLDSSQWQKIILRPSLLWTAFGSLFLFFRTILWFRYRPIAAAGSAEAPMLTVIIPAYNEGAMVRKTITSVVHDSYPHDRLEIIVVDDGSKDDTWRHIEKVAKQYPQLVTAIRFSQNQGKRYALNAGFRRAAGEVVVTIDSDSVIEPGTLLSMAGAFCDSRVGAVAGKVIVYNRKQGIIPRMLNVRYMLSFDFLRAVQSSYGTVYCCPGALAAYRMSAVKEVLDDWMNQVFWGTKCTYGEDRSLTNYLLSRGYDTVYQRNAVVHTVVPHTYSKLCRMLLRWERSYVREEIRFIRIIWKRQPKALFISLVDYLLRNLRYPVGYASLVLLIVHSVSDPLTIIRLLFAIGIMSSLNMLYYLNSERSWDFLYGILYSYFSFFTLFWIFPYAVVSVRSRSWMTR